MQAPGGCNALVYMFDHVLLAQVLLSTYDFTYSFAVPSLLKCSGNELILGLVCEVDERTSPCQKHF